MKNAIYGWTLAAAAAVSSAAVPAMASITFLDHFNNQTAFSLNPSAGDYAGGSGTAVVSGSLGTDTGFFGGADKALYISPTNTGNDYIDINGAGNIQYTSSTSGGVTVGAWIKMGADSYQNSDVVGLGESSGVNLLVLSYGQSNTHLARTLYYGGSYTLQNASPATATSATDWIYVATTLDLSNQLLSLYVYNSAGVLQSTNSTAIINGFDVSTTGEVRIGGYEGTSGVWIDEASIDNQVLSGAEIQARVTSMVNGTPLAVPEPAMLSLLGLGGVICLRRRNAMNDADARMSAAGLPLRH